MGVCCCLWAFLLFFFCRILEIFVVSGCLQHPFQTPTQQPQENFTHLTTTRNPLFHQPDVIGALRLDEDGDGMQTGYPESLDGVGTHVQHTVLVLVVVVVVIET